MDDVRLVGAAGDENDPLRRHNLTDSLGDAVGGVKFLAEVLAHDAPGDLGQGNNVGVQVEGDAVLVKTQVAVHADAQDGDGQRAVLVKIGVQSVPLGLYILGRAVDDVAGGKGLLQPGQKLLAVEEAAGALVGIGQSHPLVQGGVVGPGYIYLTPVHQIREGVDGAQGRLSAGKAQKTVGTPAKALRGELRGPAAHLLIISANNDLHGIPPSQSQSII